MSDGWVYFDGELVPVSKARVPVDDLGWLLGLGAFETLRAYEGHCFRLRDHVMRLSATLEWLGISVPEGAQALGRAAESLVGRVGIPDARVRITVSAGPGLPDAEPHRLITARPADPPATEAYAEGIRAVVEPLPHGLGPVAGHKVTSYASYVLARRSAVARGAGEALLVDPEGRVVEGAFSNLFAVVDGEVITPPLAQGPLPGVTRQVVLELLAEMAPACRQETVTVTTLREAAELFVTSSVAEVLPVTRLGDQPVGDGRPGPVTRQVQQAYQDCVRRETRRRSDT